MKIKLILICLLFFSSDLNAQISLDSMIIYNYDSKSNTYTIYQGNYFFFNSYGMLIRKELKNAEYPFCYETRDYFYYVDGNLEKEKIAYVCPEHENIGSNNSITYEYDYDQNGIATHVNKIIENRLKKDHKPNRNSITNFKESGVLAKAKGLFILPPQSDVIQKDELGRPILLKQELCNWKSEYKIKYFDKKRVLEEEMIKKNIESGRVTSHKKTKYFYSNKEFKKPIFERIQTVPILFYPNPFDDIVNLKSKSEDDIPLQIEIYSSNGNLVKSIINGKENSQILQTINLSNLLDGIYFIKIKTNNGIVTKKILKIGGSRKA